MTQLDDVWFAVQVRPKAERSVASLLGQKGYQPFLPMYMDRRRWSDRTKQLEVPLIPSYVFCRSTGDAIGRVVTTPGVIRIVGAGRTPIAVDPGEIEALQRIDAFRLRAQPFPFFHEGQIVEVLAGPLKGARGKLIRIKTGDRLAISITLLQRSVAVEIDAAVVAPVHLVA